MLVATATTIDFPLALAPGRVETDLFRPSHSRVARSRTPRSIPARMQLQTYSFVGENRLASRADPLTVSWSVSLS